MSLRTTSRKYLTSLVTVAAMLAPALATPAPPTFTLEFIGDGTPVAINNTGTIAGVRTNSATGVQTPLISTAGRAWQPLPAPSGATTTFPTDINDTAAIAGVSTVAGARRAVRWLDSGSGYAVQILPLLPGELAAYATAINNRGQIVGARAGILGTPFGFGWLYSDAEGLVDLNGRYGWFATPNDINDDGVILSGTQTFDLATGTLTDVGLLGPANYNAIGGVAINDAGQIVGEASLRSSSLNIRTVYRYTPGAGWIRIAGTSRYTIGSDINAGGDVTFSEQAPAIYLEGLGTFALGDLLDPATRAAGWILTGLAPKINDSGVIATLGRNTLTGQSGTVRLIPGGALLPPAAPTNLTAVPHPATRAEPYVSINLAWVNADPLLTRTYELQRRVTGGDWLPVPLVPPAMSTSHQDTTVAPATTYDYRVRAIGVAGPGPWSATARATSPSTPLDTTAPVVQIAQPADGSTVGGTITVAATATDNVGVQSLELSYWNPFQGQYVPLGSVSGQGSISLPWNTAGLQPGTYVLRAMATDAIGNFGLDEHSVTVAATATAMRVTRIDLSASRRRGTVTATGVVTVRALSGAAVANADLSVRWSLPDGSIRAFTQRTDANGRATFRTSGPRGTYTLSITGVVRSGYQFDAAGSVLSASVTR